MPDDLPTLADLRRKTPRRAAKASPAAPSLFDMVPAPPRQPAAPPAAPVGMRPTQPPVEAPAPTDRVYTVAELVAQLRGLVERTYAHITVEGEISNWRPSASGHCYFTLKDGAAQLSIVLFRRQAQLLRFKPKDGDAVRIRGQLSVYDSRGQLQLIAEFMQQTGLGAMLAAVQELKARLRREGLFDNERPLPPFPHCIGVVTSLQGAALRDIVKVCRRRHAAVRLLIYPAAVQGPNCPAEVAAGVNWFSRHAELADVVLVARGGGSWEDLHGFDHELVVRAIAACSVPVITGVGHATDTVLADAAADVCAPTPSAAAEIVTATQHGLAERVARLHSRLLRAARYELLSTQQRLGRLSAEDVLRRTLIALERRSQRLDDLTQRAEGALRESQRQRTAQLTHSVARLSRRAPALRLSEDRSRLSALHARLCAARSPAFAAVQMRLARAGHQLEALSPLKVLERGYALVYAADGSLLRDAADAAPNTRITAQLAKGRLRATVTGRD